MKTNINKKIITFAFALLFALPLVSHADYESYGSGDFYSYGSDYGSGDYYSSGNYSSGDYYSYTPSYSSGDYYSSGNYGSGDYYSSSNYGSGDYYSYTPSYSSGDYYSSGNYSSGDYYSYTPSYSSGDYYSYTPSYSSGDYYSYTPSYSSGDYYSYTPSYSSGDFNSYVPYYDTPSSYVDNSNYYTPSYENYDYGYNQDYGYAQDYGYGQDYYSAYQDYYPSYAYNYGSNNNYNGCTSNCGGSNNNTTYDSLSVICTVSDRAIEEEDSVTFTADASGGRGSYTYKWTGDVTGSSRSVTKQFNTEGTYYGKVKVTDSKGNTATANCASVNVEKITPRYDDLDVICTVSDRIIDEDESVTFTADADGGRGSYIYRWSGDVSGSSRTVTERFTNTGTYYGTVKVTDQDGRTATANCSSVKVERSTDTDFDAICKASDTSIEEGDTVRFTAEVDGGDSPYRYDWSGDVDSSSKNVTARFNNSGTYEVDLKVTDDDGNVARDTCTVRVKDNNNNNTHTNSNNSNNDGNLASVSSVYLNQVPYTGPEDVAKGIAFGVGILAWSIAGALIIRKKMNKRAISSRIEAFKEMNRSTK